MAEWYSIVGLAQVCLPVTSWQTLGCFQFLVTVNNTGVNTCADAFSALSGVRPGVRLRISWWLCGEPCADLLNCLPRRAQHLAIPSSVLVCSHTPRCLWLLFPPGCEVASCGLDLHALATNGIEPLLCLLSALFGEVSIQRLWPFYLLPSFEEQKFLILMKSNFSVLFLALLAFYLRNYCLIQGQEDLCFPLILL